MSMDEEKHVVGNSVGGTITHSGASSDGMANIYVDPALEKRVMCKFDKFILPQFAILVLIAYLDRSNIGRIHLSLPINLLAPSSFRKRKAFGLEDDLNFKFNDFGNISTLFYVAYVVFETPWVMAVKRYGANSVLAVAFVCWSVVTIRIGFITNYGQAIVLRLLLGLFEAGLFSSLTFVISTIYSREKQANG